MSREDNQPADSRPQEFWDDPRPCDHGVLLGDQIRMYIKLMGMLEVDPVDEAGLDPIDDQVEAAAYNMRVGTRYFQDSEMKNLKPGQAITIQPNGLVYVQVLEKLSLPYYLIARPNLKVRQTYRGLLLGTGPQMSPGFQGRPSFPIHNFTNQPKALFYGEQFVQVDFIKTTPLPPDAGTDKNYLPNKKDKKLVGVTGEPLEPWPGHDDPLPRDKATQALLPGGESVVSGLEELNQRVNQYLSRQVIQFAVVFAAIAILLGVMTLFFDLQRHVTGAILPGETAVEQLEAGIASANASADDADQALRDRLTIVEEQLEALGAEVERQGQGGGG